MDAQRSSSAAGSAEAAPTAPALRHAPGSAETHPPELLLVDDDVDDHELVRSALAACGFAGHFAAVESVDDALARIEQNRAPRLVLLDLNLPGKNGLELLREVRERRDLLATRIVVLTTSRAPDDVRGAWRWGADGYVVKPSAYADWRDAMESLVRYWFRAVRFP